MLFIRTPRKLTLVEKDGYRYTIDVSCLNKEETKALGDALDNLTLELVQTSSGGRTPNGSIKFTSRNLSFAHFNIIGFTADVGIEEDEE